MIVSPVPGQRTPETQLAAIDLKMQVSIMYNGVRRPLCPRPVLPRPVYAL
jgi:hypothetical protein